MKPLLSHALPALLLVAAAAANVNAQSLVEVARQERMRREALARQAGPNAAPPRVYTDADLAHAGGLTVRIGDAAPDAPGLPAPAGSEAPAPPPPMPRPPATSNGGETA